MLRIICLLLLFVAQKATARLIQPGIECFGMFAHSNLKPAISSGSFLIDSRKINPGIGMFNECTFGNGFGLKFGLRYVNYGLIVRAQRQYPLPADRGDAISWDMRYSGIYVPVSLTKKFYGSDGRQTFVSAGVSWGYLNAEYARVQVMNTEQSNFSVDYSGFNQLLGGQAIHFLELGAGTTPFPKIPQLQVALLLSRQVARVNLDGFEASFSDRQGGPGIRYQASVQTLYTQVALQVIVQFRTSGTPIRYNSNDCPKW